ASLRFVSVLPIHWVETVVPRVCRGLIPWFQSRQWTLDELGIPTVNADRRRESLTRRVHVAEESGWRDARVWFKLGFECGTVITDSCRASRHQYSSHKSMPGRTDALEKNVRDDPNTFCPSGGTFNVGQASNWATAFVLVILCCCVLMLPARAQQQAP